MKICLTCGHHYENSKWQCMSCGTMPEINKGYAIFSPEWAKKSEGFKPEYFANLANLEAGNFWFRARNRLITFALERYFPQAKEFFEIGCGTGFVLSGIKQKFPHLNLFGSDIYSIALPYVAERLNKATLFQMDARNIPFINEFSVIGAFDVLEHIKEDEKVLSQMYQAVRPGGGILLTVPQHKFLWSQQDVRACHVRRYAAQELKSKVTKAGFKILKITSFVSLLLPLMFISRFYKRNPAKEYDASAELKLSPFINNIFEKILNLEQKLIYWGGTLPMGGSLLLVAQKPEKILD